MLPSGSTSAVSVTPAVGDDISCVVTKTAKDAGLTLVKSANLIGAGVAGDTVEWSYLVTNSGGLAVTDLVVDEVATTANGSLGAVSVP